MTISKANLIKVCEKILRKLRKNYPELKKDKISLKIIKLKNYSMWAKEINKGDYKILIDYERYKDATSNEICGALAHELIHFEDYGQRTKFRMILDRILYNFRIYRKLVERSVDKRVIKRGYSKELIDNRERMFRKASAKLLYYNRGVYMLPEEVKSYAKKINKW